MVPRLLDAEILRIRETIASHGAFNLTAAELSVLCSDYEPDMLFRCLVELALEEQWAFTFLPDGRIRLTPLDPSSEGNATDSQFA